MVFSYNRLNYKCNISLTVCPKRKERGNAVTRNLSLSPKRTKYSSIYSYKGKKKKLKFTDPIKKRRIFGKLAHNN